MTSTLQFMTKDARGLHGVTPMHTFAAYADADELAVVTLPYLERALERGEAVYVNLRGDRLATLQDRLGSDADRVRWSDTDEWIPHPVRRLHAIEELVAAHRGPGVLRFVGECGFQDDAPAEVAAEWLRFDAVLNLTLSGANADMLCLYDTSRVDAAVVARARRTHPQGLDGPSGEYLPPSAFVVSSTPSRLELPEPVLCLHDARETSAARAFVTRRAAEQLQAEQVEDLTVVVTELVANAWRAGAKEVRLALWQTMGATVLQVDDDGRGIEDPLAGYRPTPPDRPNGRGLWITRQLCDVTEIAPRQPRGTSVRVRLLAPSSRAPRSSKIC